MRLILVSLQAFGGYGSRDRRLVAKVSFGSQVAVGQLRMDLVA